MQQVASISFENTAIAFAYKSDKELRKANFIFSMVNHPWMSFLATGAVKLSFKAGLPIEGLIRSTAFDHFCGGESIEESQEVISMLGRYHIGTILDYSVEGEKSEHGFDATMEEVLRTLDKASASKHIPFCVFKVTGLAAAELLEKLNSGTVLSKEEQDAFARVNDRVDRICARAAEYEVPVLIDAEETWIQKPIDELADKMMARYNTRRAIVYNTYQMYCKGTMDNLMNDHADAVKGGYVIGAKLVRGAYMEKERKRADKLGYESPIQENKRATDDAFNHAIKFSVEHIDTIHPMCGSHNEYSNLYLTRLMSEHRLSPDDNRVWFAQLYGMSDNISFNLANANFNVAKYVPYGPVKSVMPYLLRRAAENTSVAGQSSRELRLIRQELKRRRSAR